MYFEFAVASNFSFLRGASHPEELMLQATHVGLAGIGLCDRNSVSGVVRAHLIKREKQLPLAYHPGARLVFADGTPDVLAYPRDRPAWGRLCRLLTRGNLRAKKGDCILYRNDLLEHVEGLELIVMETSTRDFPPAPLLRDLQGHEISGDEGKTDAGAKLRLVAGKEENPGANEIRLLSLLREAARGRVRLAASMLYRGNDRARLTKRTQTAAQARVPLIAVNDVLYHHPDRRELQDVLTCIREHLTIDQAGRRLAVNAERYLKPPAEMARLFRAAPEAIDETLALDEALTFSLDELRYEYPDEMRAGFASTQEALVHLAWEGAATRYPEGIPDNVRQALDHELALIGKLDYAPYFLTVHSIVEFARSRNILCQGRGSAANSAVCYCLRITDVDPRDGRLLFERFISSDRDEPPDIDVDFEHERREEVIQHIYQHYGRDHTGIAATVISYRGRSAIREVGKVFGLSEDTIGALSSSIWGMGGGGVRAADLKKTGIDLASARVQKMQALALAIQSFPRHLSQHVGGFVITRSPLDEVVPIGNGAMAERTFVEWDKDDLDALGILKVDVLGLGMLTCVRKAFELTEKHYGVSFRASATIAVRSPPHRTRACPGSALECASRAGPTCGGEGSGVGVVWQCNNVAHALPPSPTLPHPNSGLPEFGTFRCPSRIDPTWAGGGSRPSLPVQNRSNAQSTTEHHQREQAKRFFTLATVPKEDPAVYRMLQRADSVGVFQVESRAQMSMLPRLKPKEFYDLVIEVAIVRPGPIQGDMVHPYLRRRQGLEPISYPSQELEAVLGKTLGVPLFQEQAMKIAIVAGGFSPGEADKLRRAMATFKRTGTIGTFKTKMIEGMVARNYPRDFAERCFGQIEGFGEYGFPESHAASFALLVYASAWLKCRYPDVFAAALLNSQPMGFYAPVQIVRDLTEHGVEARPIDINHSAWDATLEPHAHPRSRVHARHREMADDILSTHALRLGFRQIKGLSEQDARRIVAARNSGAVHEQRHELGALPLPFGERVGVRGIGSLEKSGPPHPLASLATSPQPNSGSPEFGTLSLPKSDISDLGWGKVESTAPPQATSDNNCALQHISYTSVRDLWLRTGLSPRIIAQLADADAFGSLGLTRRQALWAAKALGRVGEREDDLPLFRARGNFAERESHQDSYCPEPVVALPPMPPGEEVVNDYRFLALSLRAHPASFLRTDLIRRGIVRNEELRTARSGERVAVSGLVTIRQRPGTASGVIFMTIEDETAVANIIVWPRTFERFRAVVLGARYIAVTGELQQEFGVIHVVASKLDDLTSLLSRLTENGPAIESLARADAVKRPHDENIDSRARGRRNPPRLGAPAALDLLASDLDVPARGSAHSPARRGGTKI
jgi:error-prone DNA polymerase